MRAAFDIRSSSTNTSAQHLLVELTCSAVSFIWFTKAGFSVSGISIYNVIQADEITSINDILAANRAYFDDILSLTVSYDFKESVLIPAEYDQQQTGEDSLSLLYGEGLNQSVLKDFITSANIYNYYRLPASLREFFAAIDAGAQVFHSSSLQLEKFNDSIDLLYCIIFPSSIKVILFSKSRLQIVQQFGYASPADAAYHLLNICERHNINSAEILLRISGLIDESSLLYAELYKYFLHIEFETIAETVYTTDALKEVPGALFQPYNCVGIMRIISGTHKGRRIAPPANMPHTRPTTDIAKEGLFNIFRNNLDFQALKTLDLFGGTGCISYELASRGVNDLTVIEKDERMFSFIRNTGTNLGLKNFKVIRSDVFRFIESCKEKFDLVFAGPPYALATIDELPTLIFSQKILKKGGWFVLEHTPRNAYRNIPSYKTERNYGTTVFSIFVEDRD